MNTPTKKLILVGGGSAGWMSALYLNKLLNHSEHNVQIQVIESPDIGTIGVGEATVHGIRSFFASMGLNEDELMRETQATLKNGILFRNWMDPVDNKTHEYFHPFESQRAGKILDTSSAFFLNKRFLHERYDHSVCVSSHLSERGHGPKSRAHPPYQGFVPYGYHLDATLLGRFLRRKAVEAGVIHIEATVSDVIVDDSNISSVIANGENYSADFFIDCTGFRGTLIEKLQNDNWHSFEDALPCNRAVAIQRDLPTTAKNNGPKPFTTATALTNGWAWQIDLANRQGTGYVYDGNRLTPDAAEAELREFIGADATILKCTHLEMKVGCRKAFWVGNCVAMGLAGGFIEPLESTGLHLIHMGVGLLATHLTTFHTTQLIRDSYNRLMSGFYEDLKQFIVLHYCLTNRTDTAFWREAATKAQYCVNLPQLLAIWKIKVCEFLDLAGSYSTTFTDENYRYILYGMQHYPHLHLRVKTQDYDRFFADQQGLINQALIRTQPMTDYLRELHKGTEFTQGI